MSISMRGRRLKQRTGLNTLVPPLKASTVACVTDSFNPFEDGQQRSLIKVIVFASLPQRAQMMIFLHIRRNSGRQYEVYSSVIIQEQDVGYVEAIWLLSAPVAARTDTIDDGSAQCGKVEAYCTGHKKQNGRSTCKRTGNWFTLASWLTSKPATQWQALEKGASLTSVLLLPTSTRRKSTMKYRKAEIPATIDITQSSTSRGTSAEITFMDVKLEARQRSFWSFRTLSRELPSEQVSLFWDRAKLKLSGQKFFLSVRHWYWGVLVWRSNSEERPSSQVNIVLRDVKCQKRVAAAIDMVNAVS
ncbi:hypothetical protein F5141DRAFT_1203466 [Pisolithus sp. B1]|nr:hypothetical protein F5141DRAFT_1203466 [Pisolithus sp. B1]